MTLSDIQLPAEFTTIARAIHSLIRGDNGSWELSFDGESISFKCPGLTGGFFDSVSIVVGSKVLRFLEAKTKIDLGEHSIKLVYPVSGLLAGNALVNSEGLAIPQAYVIAPGVTDPIAHHLSADADGNFTLRLKTRLAGIALAARILV